MISYPSTFVTPISHHGPIIDVIINNVDGRFSGIRAKGLIDTGATDILISQDIATKLALRHINDDALSGVGGGMVHSKVYVGFIEVPSLEFRRIVPLHAVPWRQDSHTILLGREFLKHFIFNYDGPQGMFHFSKPLDEMREYPENLDG